jgi:replicative DNA helicase
MAAPASRGADAGLERRVPPNSQTAEVAVLGGILLRQDSLDLVRDQLEVDDFYTPAHQKIFLALCGLHDRGAAIDPVTLRNELTDRGRLDEVGGADYLDRIQDEVYTAANIEHHALIVANKAVLRRLLDATHTIQGLVFDGRGASDDDDLGAEQIIDRSQQLVFDIARDKVAAPYLSLEAVIGEALEYVDERNQAGGDLAGYTTGFPDLDRITNGLKPNELVILAARPAMGKTSLALNIATNLALHEKKSVLFFSLEMGAVQIGLRLLTSLAGVPADNVMKGRLTDEDYSNISQAAGLLGELPFFVDDLSGTNINTIRAKSRRLRAERGELGLIVVDYLQLMNTTRPRDSREQQIADISRNLKFLAKDVSCPVLALAQLSRKPEERDNKRPRLSDLRESGSLEQDADMVMFIYRDSAYHDEAKAGEPHPEPRKSELIVAKNRSGMADTVNLTFNGEFTRFDSYTRFED